MTISMDGKYQTRDGSKSVRILCVDRPDSLYPVVALLDGSPETFTASGRYTVTSESRLDLLPIPQPPRLVPLEAKDVPPGSFIRSQLWHEDVYEPVFPHTNMTGVIRGIGNVSIPLSYSDMMSGGWQILRPGSTEWQPCSKPEGAVS